MEITISDVAPVTLPKLLSITNNFLETSEEFKKNNFQYKKHL